MNAHITRTCIGAALAAIVSAPAIATVTVDSRSSRINFSVLAESGPDVDHFTISPGIEENSLTAPFSCVAAG